MLCAAASRRGPIVIFTRFAPFYDLRRIKSSFDVLFIGTDVNQPFSAALSNFKLP